MGLFHFRQSSVPPRLPVCLARSRYVMQLQTAACERNKGQQQLRRRLLESLRKFERLFKVIGSVRAKTPKELDRSYSCYLIRS